MRAEHFELLVEEPSMEAFLMAVLPKILGDHATFAVHAHQGKLDLLSKLEARLRGYAAWLPNNWRSVVLLDRDDDECVKLKKTMEDTASAARLLSRSNRGERPWQIVNRIAVEELEAWFVGEWASVRRAYPKLPGTIPRHAPYRHGDDISGGTWEALERVLRRSGYFGGGIRKIELARAVGERFDHAVCVSPSFMVFRQAVIEALT